MSVLTKIAYFQNRRDAAPNQELAKALAKGKNRTGILEIAENLWNKNRRIQSDCIKVLYEICYLDPTLIVEYTEDFINLLSNQQNRLVWGSMIALSTIAEINADQLYTHLDKIQRAMKIGSVITIDSAVKTLAGIASVNHAYCDVIFPYLLTHLATCRPKDVPQHAEKTMIAVHSENKAAFLALLEGRMGEMSTSQEKRIKKLIRQVEQR